MMPLGTQELARLVDESSELRALVGDAHPAVAALDRYAVSTVVSQVDRAAIEDAIRLVAAQAEVGPPAWSSDYSRARRAMALLMRLPKEDVTTFEQSGEDILLVVHTSPLGIPGLEWVYPDSRAAMPVNMRGTA